MYRKRSKAATVSKPISPKKPTKQSISFDSPSLSMSKEKSNSSRRSPSPDDLFEDSPDEITDDMEVDEPQQKRNRLSLSMIVASQRSSSQMTQSRMELDKSDLNESRGKENVKTNNENRKLSNKSNEKQLLNTENINKENSASTNNHKEKTKTKFNLSRTSQSQSHATKITSQSKTTSQSSLRTNQKRNEKNDNEDIQDVLEMLSTPPQKRNNEGNAKKIVQSKKTSRILSYMEDVVCNAGMTLCDEVQTTNKLGRNQALFIRDVTKALTHDKRRRDSKQCVDNFMEDFEKYCMDKNKFKTALLPTQSSGDGCLSNIETQDSLVRLLLSIDLLQSRILDFLIDKLNQFTSNYGAVADAADNEMTWTQLIINQLRYLNKVSSFETATAKLFRVIQTTAIIDVKHEIIKFLPDIIGDDQRKEVVDELISVMHNDRGLSASVLMALQNLCLNEDELARLRHGVIEALRKAPLEHVPAFVWFLLSTATPATNDESCHFRHLSIKSRMQHYTYLKVVFGTWWVGPCLSMVTDSSNQVCRSGYQVDHQSLHNLYFSVQSTNVLEQVGNLMMEKLPAHKMSLNNSNQVMDNVQIISI